MQTIDFETTIHNGIITLPEKCKTWSEKEVRVIVLYKSTVSPTIGKPRKPHPAIAGKGKTIGDLIVPVADESDWECLK